MDFRFYAYLLKCADGSFYAGHTDQLGIRVEQHQQGLGGAHTRSRRPVQLVWHQPFGTRDEAKAAEAQIKGWGRAKKEALIAGRFDDLVRLGSRGVTGWAKDRAAERALRDASLRPAPGAGLRKAPQGRGDGARKGSR